MIGCVLCMFYVFSMCFQWFPGPQLWQLYAVELATLWVHRQKAQLCVATRRRHPKAACLSHLSQSTLATAQTAQTELKLSWGSAEVMQVMPRLCLVNEIHGDLWSPNWRWQIVWQESSLAEDLGPVWYHQDGEWAERNSGSPPGFCQSTCTSTTGDLSLEQYYWASCIFAVKGTCSSPERLLNMINFSMQIYHLPFMVFCCFFPVVGNVM